MEIVLIVILVAATAGAIFYAGRTSRRYQKIIETKDTEYQQGLKSKETEIAGLQTQIAGLQASNTDLQIEAQKHITRAEGLEAVIADMREREKAGAERMKAEEQRRIEREKSQEDRFRNLANEIMEANTRRFSETSTQKLGDILTPFRDNIENFRKIIDEKFTRETTERASLKTEIEHLVELNRAIGKEAGDLTRALKANPKVQGDWGEMILETLLEKSGLEKGRQFDVQVSHDEDGRKYTDAQGHGIRADVVMYYPDERCVVIDSKVSLTAFAEYINAEDEETRRAAGRDHVTSIRGHLKELADGKYQDVIGKRRMDFVLMFVPNEGAYIAAMQLEPNLWQEAYDKRVLIVSPTQLISVLNMLNQLWKQDAVNRNVEEIARLSGSMIDKFSGMMDALDDVDKKIEAAHASLGTYRSRLSTGKGNLFNTARRIQDLGAKSAKRLPEA